MSRLTVIGDALLDRDLEGRAERLAPDAPVPVVDAIEGRPRAGGAGLTATLAARAGHDVTLVCALGDDAAGRELRELLERAGVELVDLGLRGATPEKIRVRAGGQTLVRLDRGGGRGSGPLRALPAADALLVSDYGHGLTAEPTVRAALALAVPLVWDPHPRGAAPTPGATLVTPNLQEALAQASTSRRGHPAGRAGRLAAGATAARVLSGHWQAVAVCVTLGADGAVLARDDGPALAVPAPAASGDACGAGDAFAAAATAALAAGALPSEAVRVAVASAAAYVGRESPSPPTPAAATLVAAGGCFDLLHAGHVRMLEQARALGDRLVVCLNSDASVTRIKGPDRPLVGERDRAAVLAALGCVDDVVIFEEDDPRAVLRQLRPDIWVKGGDYAISDLPEAETLAEWGGQAVLVPYVNGHSTSALIGKAATRA
jgi:rfaE bifunctional protein nucleotidyltransferase chain/domain/rfaE bifunctional protein kinase chain/domain